MDDPKARETLHLIYKGDRYATEYFKQSYDNFVAEELSRRYGGWILPESVLDNFIRMASIRDLSRSLLTIEQMLRFLVADLSGRQQLGKYLPEDILRAIAENILTISDYELVIDTDRVLTPEYLSSHVAPYLTALATVQHRRDNMTSEPTHDVVIQLIKQQSPLTIDLGGAANAVNALKEDIVPWRKKNAQRVAELKAKEAEAEIRKIEAEAAQIRAASAKDRAEAEKLKAEAEKIRIENERQKEEIKKLKFELGSAKLQLALDIVSKMRPELSDNEKLVYAFQMLPAIDTLATSEIEPVIELRFLK